MISLVIIEEISLLRIGIRTAVEAEGGVDVIADSIPDGNAMAMVEHLRPDAVLMSLRWSDPDAVAVCRQIRERSPSTRVLIMSYQDREEEMLSSILAGASGYVSRNAQGPELVRAIRIAVNGGGYFDWKTVERMIGRLQNSAGTESPASIPDGLSDREVVILRMVGEGCGNREIGQQLNIAPATARNNINKILGKLGLRSRARLVSYAARRGILMEPGDPAVEPSD